MLEERVLYLINAEIDGELTPQERVELESILRSVPEARTMKAELQKLANLMETMPEQEPPAGLAGRILQQVSLPARQPLRRSKWSLAGLVASFQPAPAGLAFAAGLLLTVGFYEARHNGGEAPDLSRMVGTMLASPASTTAEQADNLSIVAPGLSGTVSLGVMGEFMILDFDLQSVQQTEIVVGLAEAGLGFGGIAHASAASNVVDESYEVSGGSLRVTNPGDHPFVVFLRRPGAQTTGPQSIGIEVTRSGESVFEGSLRFEGQGG